MRGRLGCGPWNKSRKKSAAANDGGQTQLQYATPRHRPAQVIHPQGINTSVTYGGKLKLSCQACAAFENQKSGRTQAALLGALTHLACDLVHFGLLGGLERILDAQQTPLFKQFVFLEIGEGRFKTSAQLIRLGVNFTQ